MYYKANDVTLHVFCISYYWCSFIYDPISIIEHVMSHFTEFPRNTEFAHTVKKNQKNIHTSQVLYF